MQHLVQGDPPFEPGQRGTQTEVDAVAEGEVVPDPAVDVEAVGLVELALVAVRRGVQQQHDAVLGDSPAVVLDVGRQDAGLDGRRRLVAEELLDGVGDEAAVLDQLAALVGVVGEDLSGPADQTGGGLVAGPGEQAAVAQYLLAW